MAQTLKLTGINGFSHPAFTRTPGGDQVHIRKGAVIKVDDDLAEYLLARNHPVSSDDVRMTFTAVDEKPTYNFASTAAPVTGSTTPAATTETAPPPAAPAPASSQRRQRGASK